MAVVPLIYRTPRNPTNPLGSPMNSSAEDPLLRSSRREAIVVTLFGIVALVYTITYCSMFGFNRSMESITFLLGFPDWVFWGVIAPWAVCTLMACFFSYVLMQDHDLESESALFIPPADGESAEANPPGKEDSHG
jgi:hypothetical protein